MLLLRMMCLIVSLAPQVDVDSVLVDVSYMHHHSQFFYVD